ncbi:ATP synthase subunit I [Nitrosomonas sp.]|uniref:ATP synthase subunit I n=1 Tax=Nitrosomonas sp. TaxID=42353 RepID=UPI0025CC2610|nr:ATP synthase subunit I [Nitrosomonas sp.]MCC6915942.1 ATP synthase subunit I [Nitrosomonas sp.]
MLSIKSRPLRVVIFWQLMFSLLAAIVCGLHSGVDAAISGFLGAIISVIAGGAYAILISRHSGYSASGVLRTALRAEATKIVVIVMALWAVFVMFKGLHPVMFIGSFVVAVLISSMALFVPEKTDK